jgi:hypothetical protein
VESDNLKTGDGRVSSNAAYDKSNNKYDTSPKIKGITLDDASNAVGVSKCPIGRAIEMKMAQEKAKEELKQWKDLVTLLEQEEDTVQVKLDPKIKQWSEEAVGSVIG